MREDSGPPTRTRSADDDARYWLRMAYRAAMSSAEPRTHVGAVLVHEQDYGRGVLLGVGVNHRRHDKPEEIIHAEAAAMAFVPEMPAGRSECRSGLTLYAPWAACLCCADEMVRKRIGAVVVHAEAIARTPERWADDVHAGLVHLIAGGVSVVVWRGYVGDCTNMIDSKVWKP